MERDSLVLDILGGFVLFEGKYRAKKILFVWKSEAMVLMVSMLRSVLQES